MSKFINIKEYGWLNRKTIPNKSYICGFCGDKVASNTGYQLGTHEDGTGKYRGGAYICPNCKNLSLISITNDIFPGHPYGSSVDNLPDKLNQLYNEARECTSNKNYTATVLLCRKILMNIAVNLGAKENKSFKQYVNFISSNGYVPPNGKDWVDHIRLKGNEANHEIHLMDENDAFELITFTEMLLKFNYEFPNMLSSDVSKSSK